MATDVKSSTAQDAAKKNAGGESSNEKSIYTVAGVIFFIGLVAIFALVVISFMNKLSTTLIICEVVAFFCMLGLLILVNRAKRRIEETRLANERYPYASVDKKEIDKIFDLIAAEERTREKLDRFAAGESIKTSVKQDGSSEEISDEKTPSRTINQTPEKNPDESGEITSVLADDGEAQEVKGQGPAGTVPQGDSQSAKDGEQVGEEQEAEGGDEAKKGERPKGKRPPGSAKGENRPKKKRPPSGAKRAPKSGASPYYDDYYYDEYGEPVRRRRPPQGYEPYYEIYYNEYGEPVRRIAPPPYMREEIYYNQYGEPVRRRVPYDPYDPRGRYGKKPAKRKDDGTMIPPAPGRKQPGGGATKGQKPKGIETAAPVAMPSADKKSYDDEYVPVYIPYDDEVDTAPAQQIPRAAAKQASAHMGAKQKGSSYQSVSGKVENEEHYDPYSIDEIPVLIPDDDEYLRMYEDSEPAPAQRQKEQRRQEQRKAPAYTPEPVVNYAPSYDDNVVVVADYDDMEERYPEQPSPQRQQRTSQPPASRVPPSQRRQPPRAKVQTHVYEDEMDYNPVQEDVVVVLPHDEGYEKFLERKKEEEKKARKEARRQERKNKNTTALVIRKMKRKKIRRKPRKYVRYRASVLRLVDFLRKYDR